VSDLRVVAVIPVSAEAVDQVRPALHTLVEATRKEDGCVSYDLFESGSAPGTFVTVECWRDAASLDAHMSMPHVAAAFAAAEGALSGAVAIHPLHPVS
jgi:quinol monooxygenase YgiN